MKNKPIFLHHAQQRMEKLWQDHTQAIDRFYDLGEGSKDEIERAAHAATEAEIEYRELWTDCNKTLIPTRAEIDAAVSAIPHTGGPDILRLLKACDLVASGHVIHYGGFVYDVWSQTDPARRYVVDIARGECGCRARQFAPTCKHLRAAQIAERVTLTAPGTPAPVTKTAETPAEILADIGF